MANRLIEIPVNNNPIITSRSLDGNHPANTSAIKSDEVDSYKKLLKEVKIRFDTNPKFYSKEDFRKLITLFGDGFAYLLLKFAPEIVTSWEETTSDIKIPSEKLVKNTFNAIHIPENVSELNNDVNYVNLTQLSVKADKIKVVDLTQNIGTSYSIEPNKLYLFGAKTDLTISLVQGESDIVNEYMIQFTSGSTATTLNVPSTVSWIKDPDIQSNKIYQVSIVNNLGVIGEWSNE